MRRLISIASRNWVEDYDDSDDNHNNDDSDDNDAHDGSDDNDNDGSEDNDDSDVLLSLHLVID